LQTEKAFQKQEGVTGCFKSKDKKAPGKSGHRFFKNVGLNFKTPKEAIDGV
jgi:small subunit ribosomal protein S11e